MNFLEKLGAFVIAIAVLTFAIIGSFALNDCITDVKSIRVVSQNIGNQIKSSSISVQQVEFTNVDLFIEGVGSNYMIVMSNHTYSLVREPEETVFLIYTNVNGWSLGVSPGRIFVKKQF